MLEAALSAFTRTVWLAVLLAGCVTQQDRVQPVAAVPQKMDADAQDDATCRSYGNLPGSDAYTKCRLQLTHGRQAAAAQAAAEHDAFTRGQVRGRAASTNNAATGSGAASCIDKPAGATVVTECR
jgi:hypothetical protein